MAPAIVSREQMRDAGVVRELLAAWRDAKDLIEIDAYVAGTNPTVDRAIALKGSLDTFCQQSVSDVITVEETRRQLSALVNPTEAS